MTDKPKPLPVESFAETNENSIFEAEAGFEVMIPQAKVRPEFYTREEADRWANLPVIEGRLRRAVEIIRWFEAHSPKAWGKPARELIAEIDGGGA